MADGNDSKSLDADYLAALRDTDFYKDAFQRAYQEPESAMTELYRYTGKFGPYSSRLNIAIPQSSEAPNEQNYSKAAQQLRQAISASPPEINDPRRVPKDATGLRGSRPGDAARTHAVFSLALTEALESHEQQGKRFDKAFMLRETREGAPKSTRSMGKTVEPMERFPTRAYGIIPGLGRDSPIPIEDKTADQTLMENMRKK